MSEGIHFTKFRGLDKPQGKSLQVVWGDLVEKFKAPAVYKDKRDMPLFSFTQFEGDYRNKENAGMVHAIVVEHDRETMTPEEAMEVMRQHCITSVIYTTPSHTWDAPRWRLVCKLTTPVDEIEHGRMVRILNHLLDGAIAPESINTEREWFYGSVKGAEYLCLANQGDTLDDLLDFDLKATERELEIEEKQAKPGAAKRRKTDVVDMLEWIPVQAEPPTEEAAERIREALAESGADPDAPYIGGKGSGPLCWRDTIMAIHSTQHPQAKSIAEDWSKQSTKFKKAEFDKLWKSMTIDRDTTVTLATLIYHAKERGWIDPNLILDEDEEVYGDIDNGKRFAEKFRGTFRFVHSMDKWMRWTGHRWEWCEGSEISAAAKMIAKEALQDANMAKAENGTERDKSNYNHALAVYRNINKVDAIHKSAASEPGMSVGNHSKFDADPWLLGVKNGVVDLQTGKLIEAKPSMLMTKQAGAQYDPDADCPKFMEFMNQIFQGDAQMIAFVQRVCGYAITGLATEQRFFFLLGSGANGKSVFSNIMDMVFGDYTITAGSALIAKNAHGHSNEADRHMAKLPGARLVLINEVGTDDVFNDVRVKELTSNDKLSARFLHNEVFEFMPTHTIFLRGNHRPGVKDAGDAFWRRVVMIDFARQFTDDEKVQNLEHIIFDKEAEGILNWVIRGCVAWQKYGLDIPKKVQADVDQYRRDSDLLGEWIEACCELKALVSETVAALYTSYRDYMVAAHMPPSMRLKFTRDLEAKGLKKEKTMVGNVMRGIKLRDDIWSDTTKEDDEEL